MPQDSPLIDWRDDGVQITLPPIKLFRCPGFWFSLVVSGLTLTFFVAGCTILVTAEDIAGRWFGGIFSTLSILFVLIGLWLLADALHHARWPVILTVDSQQLSIQGDLLFGRVEYLPRTSIQAIIADDWGLWILDDKRPSLRLRYHIPGLPKVAAVLRQALSVSGEWPLEPGEIPVTTIFVEDDTAVPARRAFVSFRGNDLQIRVPGADHKFLLKGYIGRPPRLRGWPRWMVPSVRDFTWSPFICPENCDWIDTPELGRRLRIAPRGVGDLHVFVWSDPPGQLEEAYASFWNQLKESAQVKI